MIPYKGYPDLVDRTEVGLENITTTISKGLSCWKEGNLFTLANGLEIRPLQSRWYWFKKEQFDPTSWRSEMEKVNTVVIAVFADILIELEKNPLWPRLAYLFTVCNNFNDALQQLSERVAKATQATEVITQLDELKNNAAILLSQIHKNRSSTEKASEKSLEELFRSFPLPFGGTPQEWLEIKTFLNWFEKNKTQREEGCYGRVVVSKEQLWIDMTKKEERKTIPFLEEQIPLIREKITFYMQWPSKEAFVVVGEMDKPHLSLPKILCNEPPDMVSAHQVVTIAEHYIHALIQFPLKKEEDNVSNVNVVALTKKSASSPQEYSKISISYGTESRLVEAVLEWLSKTLFTCSRENLQGSIQGITNNSFRTNLKKEWALENLNHYLNSWLLNPIRSLTEESRFYTKFSFANLPYVQENLRELITQLTAGLEKDSPKREELQEAHKWVIEQLKSFMNCEEKVREEAMRETLVVFIKVVQSLLGNFKVDSLGVLATHKLFQEAWKKLQGWKKRDTAPTLVEIVTLALQIKLKCKHLPTLFTLREENEQKYLVVGTKQAREQHVALYDWKKKEFICEKERSEEQIQTENEMFTFLEQSLELQRKRKVFKQLQQTVRSTKEKTTVENGENSFAEKLEEKQKEWAVGTTDTSERVNESGKYTTALLQLNVEELIHQSPLDILEKTVLQNALTRELKRVYGCPKYIGTFKREEKTWERTTLILGPNLEEHVRLSPHTEGEKLNLMKQLAQLVQLFHKNNFRFRDLKLEQFVMGPDGVVYLIDGKGISHKSQEKKSTVITPLLLPPETWENKTSIQDLQDTISLDECVDIWMLGWMFYQILTGNTALPHESRYFQLLKDCKSNEQTAIESYYKWLLERTQKGEHWTALSESSYFFYSIPFAMQANELLRMMLSTDTNKRPIAEAVVERLKNFPIQP